MNEPKKGEAWRRGYETGFAEGESATAVNCADHEAEAFKDGVRACVKVVKETKEYTKFDDMVKSLDKLLK